MRTSLGHHHRLAWVCGLFAGSLWAICHLAFHWDKPWLSWQLGEWDVVLVAEALLAGERVDLQVGAIHGHELGAYLVALLLLPLRWLGMSSLLASKTLVTLLGAGVAGIASASAAVLAQRRVGTGRGVVAGVLVGLVLSVCWPNWHGDLAGLSGRTPEAALPALGAGLLLFRSQSPSRMRLAGAGVLLGIAWILSPASIWMLGLGTLVVLIPAGKEVIDEGQPLAVLTPLTIRLVLFAGCVALPLVLMGVCVPGGWDGVGEFLGKQLNQAGEALSGQATSQPVASGERGVFAALAAAPGVMSSVGSAGGSLVASTALRLVGWAVFLSCAAGLTTSLVRRRFTTESLCVLAALSFLVPLRLIAVGPDDLASASRYFAVPLCLCVVASSVWWSTLLFPAGRWELFPALGLGLVALLPLPGIGSFDHAPSWSLEQSLVSTGAHGLPVLPGRDRHTAFRALLPGVPAEARTAFIEGYGMDLGGEAALILWEREPVGVLWHSLVGEFGESEGRSLMLGVGCGLSRMDVDEGVLHYALSEPTQYRADLFYGLALCLFDETRTHLTSLVAPEAWVDGLSGLPREDWAEGRRDAGRLPPRTPGRSAVGNPAERMRALPPKGPRPDPKPEAAPEPEAAL